MSDKFNHRDRNSNRRDRNPRGDGGDHFPQRETRKPLEWKALETVRKGNVKLEITGAETQSGGRLYSCRLGKITGTDEQGAERASGFFKPDDFENLRAVLTEAQNWIDCDREELRKKQGNTGRRFG